MVYLICIYIERYIHTLYSNATTFMFDLNNSAMFITIYYSFMVDIKTSLTHDIEPSFIV
jgi:hypothetical protein